MSNTTTTATDIAKTDTPTAPGKLAKPQRRMARPALDDAKAVTPSAATPTTAQTKAKPAPATKTTAVIALLERDTGATLSELIEATGWLPHTTRAALTGLRKKGHAIERSKRGDETCYCIAPGAAGNVKPA